MLIGATFDDTDTKILKVCIHVMLMVLLNSKLYFAVKYFEDFCLPFIVPNFEMPSKYECR